MTKAQQALLAAYESASQEEKSYWSCWLLASFQITQKVLNQCYPIVVGQASRRLSKHLIICLSSSWETISLRNWDSPSVLVCVS